VSTDHTAIMHRYVEELWNQGNTSLIEELIAPTFVLHSARTAAPLRGHAGFKQLFALARTAFPDGRFTIENMFAAGDKLAARWIMHGTHTGAFMGIAPTGKVVTWKFMAMYRFADGKITEAWSIGDDLGLLQQLGVVPK
jgi:steroid delta-isomerase-like uncharacterized protein